MGKLKNKKVEDRDILRYRELGYTTTEIAKQLGVNERTIEYHNKKLTQKQLLEQKGYGKGLQIKVLDRSHREEILKVCKETLDYNVLLQAPPAKGKTQGIIEYMGREYNIGNQKQKIIFLDAYAEDFSIGNYGTQFDAGWIVTGSGRSRMCGVPQLQNWMRYCETQCSEYPISNTCNKCTRLRNKKYINPNFEEFQPFINKLSPHNPKHITEAVAKAYGEEYNICPYEMVTKLIPISDILLTHSINLFNSTKRFAISDCALLVCDEADKNPAVVRKQSYVDLPTYKVGYSAFSEYSQWFWERYLKPIIPSHYENFESNLRNYIQICKRCEEIIKNNGFGQVGEFDDKQTYAVTELINRFEKPKQFHKELIGILTQLFENGHLTDMLIHTLNLLKGCDFLKTSQEAVILTRNDMGRHTYSMLKTKFSKEGDWYLDLSPANNPLNDRSKGTLITSAMLSNAYPIDMELHKWTDDNTKNFGLSSRLDFSTISRFANKNRLSSTKTGKELVSGGTNSFFIKTVESIIENNNIVWMIFGRAEEARLMKKICEKMLLGAQGMIFIEPDESGEFLINPNDLQKLILKRKEKYLPLIIIDYSRGSFERGGLRFRGIEVVCGMNLPLINKTQAKFDFTIRERIFKSVGQLGLIGTEEIEWVLSALVSMLQHIMRFFVEEPFETTMVLFDNNFIKYKQVIINVAKWSELILGIIPEVDLYSDPPTIEQFENFKQILKSYH